MREFSYVLTNYLAHLLLVVALTALQVSLWLQVFGYSPAPALWILSLNFWVLRRRPFEAVLMSYLIAFVISSMTSMPLSMVFAVCLSLVGLILLLKDRVLWAGISHFTLSTAISVFSLPIIIYLWSFVIEAQPIKDFHLFSWLLSPLLTALVSLFVYPILIQIDHFTRRDSTRNSEAEIL